MEGEATSSSDEEEPKSEPGEKSFLGGHRKHAEDGDNFVAPSLEELPLPAAEEEEEEETEEWRSFPERLFRKFAEQPIKLRVHDLRIEGNVRTKDSVIEAEFEKVKNAETSNELLQEVALANSRIESLGIFEECIIGLEPGPVELPGTANVIVNLKEPSRLYSGDMGVYSKPETRSWILEGSLKLKNLLGRAETWDGTGSCSWDGTTAFSAGLYYPRFKDLPAAFVTRASVFSQDWVKYSSYTERLVGLSAGLVTAKRHDLSYNLTWRTLEDPEHTASRSVRRQLGHSLLSSLKYTFKIDKRDSSLRPTKGYAFRSATQIAGIGPDSNLLRFVRQELDVRCAIPLGFFNAALNVGISGGLMMPWGEGFRQKTTSISDRFFIGGHTSLVCGLNGPVTVSGFRSRGLGPMDLRRRALTVTEGSEPVETSDTLGGDLALTGFADLSFDLPLDYLREQDIHAHCFLSAGNLFGLPELNRQNMTWQKICSSTRVSAGAGVVIPTRLLRFEGVNEGY
ncbi:hypothetical protein L7F22_021084 [Adiantum nelumboides]|nr:hypothetical protein [Adiantum nelumboides]